jgi:twitching motility protein PilT
MDLFSVIREAFQKQASDLFLSAGKPIYMRRQGKLSIYQRRALSAHQMEEICRSLLSPSQFDRLRSAEEIDLALFHPDGFRVRLHVYLQSGQLSLSIRLFPKEIPLPEEIGIPSVVQQLVHKEQGLLLITGPTGSGKSTTLAALIHDLNQKVTKRIITLEDPIEYVHRSYLSMIEQRQVGRDTVSFLTGLRAALRQDPDLILLGELRDLETMQAAIQAAETGKLVLATLHTDRSISAISRFIDVFPAMQQNQIRAQLSMNLLAVVAQRLVPKRNSITERVAVFEVLINTPAVSHLIRTDQLHQLPSLLQTGQGQGMQSMERALQKLQSEGLFDGSLALKWSDQVGEQNG